MAVRCSMLGHDFGTTEVEREREERGSEVVVTVTEYEACTRCGARNVKSENTEVRRLEPEQGGEPADAGHELSESAAETDGAAEPAPSGESDPSAEPDPLGEGGPEPSETESDPLPTDEHGEPITDDAEILDETDPVEDDHGRKHGAWPDSDDVGQSDTMSDDTAEWPAVDAADERDGDDAVVTNGSAQSDAGSAGQEASASGSGIQRAGAAPTPGETAPRDGVPIEFFCPRCAFVAPGDRSSLRAGDICPECKKGYLGERER